MEIKKINKNFYQILVEPICTVLLDEYLMKKALKILYKYQNEMDALLQNNPEHLIKEEWSLVYPNGEQTAFYGTDLKKPKKIRTPNFKVRKIENLFYIGERDIYSDEVREEITKLMELETDENSRKEKK
jgi:hypothetical protein